MARNLDLRGIAAALIPGSSLMVLLWAAPAHALDPRCGNRFATGSFVCVIDKPVVSQHETAYPTVQFAPGDVVDVQADGCVQTGGAGNTWKRYVNPTGSGIDHLYHGLVRIPSAEPAGSGLVRIETVIGRRQTVTGTGADQSQLVMHLGYEDDEYADNGYYSHDDGNDDQCKNDHGHGGPAQVRITITRGVTAPGTDSRFDFDVLSSHASDPNQLLYNPHWAWQQHAGHQGQIPSTSSCHNFSKSDTLGGLPSPVLAPNFPDCTDQADASSVDLPDGLNAQICRVGGIFKSDSFAGHVNWFPVTLEGHAGWGDESVDDDNTFTFTSDEAGNPLSVNGRAGLHIEFDSDETTKHFGSNEWTAFHGAVDSDNHDLAKKLFDGHTVLTGMFGLDGEHNLKSELHPLFAMATRRENLENSPGDDTWLIFVRNRGDEGFCSSQLWDLGFEDYTFRLPWLAGMGSVDVDWNRTQFEGTDGTSGPNVAVLPPPSADAGVYVTYHLGPSLTSPFIDGALHLVWTPAAVASAGVATRVTGKLTAHPITLAEDTKAGEVDEVETRIRAAEIRIAPAQRQSVQLARAVDATGPAVHRLPRGTPVQKIAVRPSAVKLARAHAISAGTATAKLERDAAQIHALCAASNNAPVGLPASLCVAR